MTHAELQLSDRTMDRQHMECACKFRSAQEEMASKLRALHQHSAAAIDAADARCAEASQHLHDARAAAQRTEAQLRCG